MEETERDKHPPIIMVYHQPKVINDNNSIIVLALASPCFYATTTRITLPVARVVSPYFPTNDQQQVVNHASLGMIKRKRSNCSRIVTRTRLCGSASQETQIKDTNISGAQARARVRVGVDFRQKEAVCNSVVRHEMNVDDTKVVSPYFIKEERGVVSKTKKRKKKAREDRLYGEGEFDCETHKVVSPYFTRRRLGDHAVSEVDYVDMVLMWKVKKARGSRKRRLCGGFMEMRKEDKVRKQRRGKKRGHDKQFSQLENDVNLGSVLGPQHAVPTCHKSNNENEIELEGDPDNFSVSPAAVEHQEVVACRVYTTEVDVEDESGNNDIKEDSVIYGKHQKRTRRSRNVKRKRVKPASLLQSKIENSQGSLTLDGCQEESEMVISNISMTTKKKKRTKKALSAASCCPTISLQGDLVSCSVRSRKKDCLHESQGCLQVSTVDKVSPYFKKELKKEELEFTISSVSSEHQKAAENLLYTTEIDVEDGDGKNGMQDDCVISGKSQKFARLCSRNVKRKRVKSASLLNSKIEKNQDFLTPDVGHEESDKVICRKRKKKKDKTASLAHSCSVIEQEGKPGSSSIQTCLQASSTQKVSPYYQTELQTDEHADISDKPDFILHNMRSCRTVSTEFDELLSQHAYKCERMVNKDQTSDSDVKKKRRVNRNTSLGAKEKLAEPYRRKAPDNTWRSPRSPFNLLQEDHVHDPWRILVICMLLNMTTGSQVKQVLSALFSLFPNAEAAVSADVLEIQRVIQSLGLHRKRAVMIQQFSREYLSDEWTHVTQLHGIGKYAGDAYAIFCNGMWNQVTPNDHMLKYYWKYLKNRGLKPV